MKWLLFFNNEDCAVKVRAALEKKDIDYESYNNKIDSVRAAKASFSSVTSVIVEKDFFACDPGMTYFLAGMIEGLKLDKVVVEARKEGELFSLIRECNEMDAVRKVSKKNLEKEFEEILIRLSAKEKQANAFEKLFCEGKPFTADSFAHFIAKEDYDVCDLYIEAGFNLDEKTSLGTPLLCEAVRAESEGMVNVLINNGANIDAVSEDRGFSPVMDAVWKKNARLVKKFVDLSANLDYIGKDGMPILVLAVGTGSTEICRILAEAGADQSVTDAMGMSAMAYAKLFHHDDIIKIFQECKK